MSSIEELKIVRLYRAYNTVIQMCMDRGYTIRRPSAVAQAVQDSSIYSDEEGLNYDWFIKHFVLRQSTAGKAEADNEEAEEKEKEVDEDETRVNDNRENQNKEKWSPLHNAMRLVCSANNNNNNEGEENSRDDGSCRKKGVMIVFFSGSPSLSMSEVQEYRTKALEKQASCVIIIASKIIPTVRRGARELSGRLRAGTTEEVMSIQLFEEDALACNIARHETVPPHEPLSNAEAQEFLQSRHLTLAQLPRILDEDPMVSYLGLARGSVVRIQRNSKESGPYEMYRQVI